MFDDLLVVLAGTFPAAAAAEAAATRAQEEDTAAGTRPEDNLGVGDSTPLAGGDGRLGETGGRNWPLPPPVFHVTEYDVTRGQYPESWEKFAGTPAYPLQLLKRNGFRVLKPSVAISALVNSSNKKTV